MKSVYLMIIYILLTISLVEGMSLMNDGTQHLERLLHKTMRYQHHRQNYEESMRTGIVPKGLRIKKAPAFEPVSKDFYISWDEILYNAEKNLIEFLLYESLKVVAKLKLIYVMENVNFILTATKKNVWEWEGKRKFMAKTLKKED